MAAKFPSPLPIRITLEVRKVFTNFFMLYLCRVEYDFCVFARKKNCQIVGKQGFGYNSQLLHKDGRQISVAASHQNHFRGKKKFWDLLSLFSFGSSSCNMRSFKEKGFFANESKTLVVPMTRLVPLDLHTICLSCN